MASVKAFLSWFMIGVAHHISIWIGRRRIGNNKVRTIFLCGPERCGTSWSSDVIALYYNLPRPKHYFLPIGFDAVLHTHLINELRYSHRTIYVERYGVDAYLSWLYKIRIGLSDSHRFVDKHGYGRKLENVEDDKYLDKNITELIKYDIERGRGIIHSLAAISVLKDKGCAVIDYDKAVFNPIDEFGDAINKVSSELDVNRLKLVHCLLSKKQQRNLEPNSRSTNINIEPSDSRLKVGERVHDYYAARLEELKLNYIDDRNKTR